MAKKISMLAAAAFVYLAFALYLYYPYFEKFTRLEYLYIINAVSAALGAFVLSRRWVAPFAGSFFAGLLYGFGPFMIGLAKFHPAAGSLAAAIPWLFCPAAFGPKGKWKFLRVPLTALPFLAIPLFFELSTRCRLFAVPIKEKLILADLLGLAAPLVSAQKNLTPIGFYHVPIAALIMGFAILLAARRISIVFILFLGTALALFGPLLNTSAVIWLSLPILCCSILIGEGTVALTSAGYSDRKWLLLTVIIEMTLTIAALLLATKYFQVFAGLADGYARLFLQSAIMYILGTIAIACIFFITRASLRLRTLRWIIICSAMIVDIFASARFIVDKML